MKDKVVGIREENGDFVFEVKSKRIIFNMDLLKELSPRNMSITNLNKRFVGGEAWRERERSFVRLNFSEIIGREKNGAFIKRKIVRCLAHEVRHLSQWRNGFIDKIGLKVTYPIFLPALIIMALVWRTVRKVIRFLGREEWEEWMVLTALILVVTASLFLLTIILFYYFSPNERDARAFGRKALKNEEWLKVVKVEDIDTP